MLWHSHCADTTLLVHKGNYIHLHIKQTDPAVSSVCCFTWIGLNLQYFHCSWSDNELFLLSIVTFPNKGKAETYLCDCYRSSKAYNWPLCETLSCRKFDYCWQPTKRAVLCCAVQPADFSQQYIQQKKEKQIFVLCRHVGFCQCVIIWKFWVWILFFMAEVSFTSILIPSTLTSLILAVNCIDTASVGTVAGRSRRLLI